MKRLLFTMLLCLSLLGCTAKTEYAQVAATTLPVYEFTAALCEGTPITVTRLITEEVSCLHDYSLNVRQVKAAEAADVIVISGAGLEAFLEDLLLNKASIDASATITLMDSAEGHAHHHHENDHSDTDHEGHSHEKDPHIWLSVPNAIHTKLKNILVNEGYQGFISIEMGKIDDLSVIETKLKYVRGVF